MMIAPSATIAEGQAVMELETDKAVVEVPSSVSGTVKDVLVKQGEKIKVGQVLFTLENGAGTKRAAAAAPQIATEETESKPSAPAPVARPAAPPKAAVAHASIPT